MIHQSGCYEILNTVNGKRYIGSAVKFVQRWDQHRSHLRKGVHHSRVLQRAWNKYGESAFKFLPILTCAKSMLLFYEQQLLDKVKPEYNASPTAGSSLGVKRTPEQCKANGDRLRGTTRPPEHCAAISAGQLGRKQSPEWCANISKGRTGTKQSPAHRAANAEARRGNKNASGKRTAAQCATITAAVQASYARRVAKGPLTWSPARRAAHNERVRLGIRYKQRIKKQEAS